jgi:hypothetical protein
MYENLRDINERLLTARDFSLGGKTMHCITLLQILGVLAVQRSRLSIATPRTCPVWGWVTYPYAAPLLVTFRALISSVVSPPATRRLADFDLKSRVLIHVAARHCQSLSPRHVEIGCTADWHGACTSFREIRPSCTDKLSLHPSPPRHVRLRAQNAKFATST